MGDEDEDKVVASVQKCQWKFDPDAFGSVSSAAKNFIEKCLIRAPEMRMTATDALAHEWLSEDYSPVRKKISLDIKDDLKETDERLFEEEENISPEDSDDEE